MYREGSYLQATVNNPVRTNDVRWREHGASSIEEGIRFLR